MVIAEMGVGGAERLVAELSLALEEAGDFVAIAADSGPTDRLLEGSAVARRRLAGRGRNPWRLVRAARDVGRAAREFEPDLIHVHNVKATGIVAVARGLTRAQLPVLSTFHGVPRDRYRPASLVLRGADVVACVSADLAQGLMAAGFPAGRLRVVPNGIADIAPLDPPTKERLDSELELGEGPVVSIVGRLVPQKAHERFIRAAAIAADAEPSCRFLIIGDGPRRSELERLVDAMGLRDCVRFLGMRDDARRLIARSDLLVFSSDWEGMPITAIEAMAASVPVVSTDVEGMRELLGEEAGVIVPREVAGLAAAIIDLLRSPGERKRMGEAGRRRYTERYSLARTIDSYRALYAELVEGRSR